MYAQAGRFIPRGASQDSIKTETPKKKKGKKKENANKTQKQKPGPETQEQRDLSPLPHSCRISISQKSCDGGV